MSAYLTALRESATRDELLAEVARLYDERNELRGRLSAPAGNSPEIRSDGSTETAPAPPSGDAPVQPEPEGERFCGYTLHEAVELAIRAGTLGAWEWLQAWWNADLTPDDDPPDRW